MDSMTDEVTRLSADISRDTERHRIRVEAVLDQTSEPPLILGEVLEDAANVYLDLSDTISADARHAN